MKISSIKAWDKFILAQYENLMTSIEVNEFIDNKNGLKIMKYKMLKGFSDLNTLFVNQTNDSHSNSYTHHQCNDNEYWDDRFLKIMKNMAYHTNDTYKHLKIEDYNNIHYMIGDKIEKLNHIFLDQLDLCGDSEGNVIEHCAYRGKQTLFNIKCSKSLELFSGTRKNTNVCCSNHYLMNPSNNVGMLSDKMSDFFGKKFASIRVITTYCLIYIRQNKLGRFNIICDATLTTLFEKEFNDNQVLPNKLTPKLLFRFIHKHINFKSNTITSAMIKSDIKSRDEQSKILEQLRS